jgi:hypothetical protein
LTYAKSKSARRRKQALETSALTPSPNTEATRPLSIRLCETDIGKLEDRARRMSGTPTGVARELIRSGLAEGDPFAQGERLLLIERRLAAIAQDVQHALGITGQSAEAIAQLETHFEDLLMALSGQLPAER